MFGADPAKTISSICATRQQHKTTRPALLLLLQQLCLLNEKSQINFQVEQTRLRPVAYINSGFAQVGGKLRSHTLHRSAREYETAKKEWRRNLPKRATTSKATNLGTQPQPREQRRSSSSRRSAGSRGGSPHNSSGPLAPLAGGSPTRLDGGHSSSRGRGGFRSSSSSSSSSSSAGGTGTLAHSSPLVAQP